MVNGILNLLSDLGTGPRIPSLRSHAWLIVVALLFGACEKDDWSPPSKLSMAPVPATIDEITYPSQFDGCENWFTYDKSDWGWFRARINGNWYVGVAVLTESADEAGRWHLSYAALDYKECYAAYAGGIGDLSPDSDDPYADLPRPAIFSACVHYPPGHVVRLPNSRESRFQTFRAFNATQRSFAYLPDTVAGLTLQVVFDDLQPEAGFGQGRFAAHYVADPTCPDIMYPSRDVYVEQGYFEAVIRR